MANLLSSVRRTIRGQNSTYEDLDGTSAEGNDSNSTLRPEILQDDFNDNVTDPDMEIEMSTVSVVPDDTFTVTQAVNAFGFGKFQVKLSLFTGLCWMADSMEMTILSILAPALHCDWHISQYQQALTTTVVFLGMMLSSTFWGNISDKYGRKQALTICAVLLFYYGLLSSFAPNYLWILFLRGLVGFAIGCVPQSVTLYAEFLPTKQRAKCVVLLDCFWALGACFEVLLALLVMPTLGWKWLLGLSTIPLFAFVCICPWLPESARFLMASGNADEALETLKRVASENGHHMLLGRLVLEDTSPHGGSLYQRGRVWDLLIPEMRRTSLLLWFIWLSCAFCYYGVVLMTTELFEASEGLCSPSFGGASSETCAADCRELNTTDYIDLLWTTLAEFPGIFATILVIEKFGRKKTMAVQFLAFGVCICFLLVCTTNRSFLTIMLFISRGIIAGIFQAAYVYTPEVYPTPLRAVGVGTCSAMARLGAMVTPYVAQVMLKSSLDIAISVYAVAAILAAVASIALPIETKGREMKESSHH
ncbi:synaptic vesicle 2-related protein [Ischnura elegans]|uniref:synaptic vesicle 2-related protein n=1 Tax=Ischnura elegans TaxID=197161 RepID=UPI001ED89DBA|nr:synaptic vesicle 2-related protein [Ischnura elegans]